MSDTPAAARWRKLADEHAQTDLSAREFAERKALNPRTFAWWRSRLRTLDATKTLPGPTFTELVVAKADPTVVLALDDLPAHVVVDADTDLALLKQLLAALC